MGIKIEIGGKELHVDDYSVTEESTPVASDDSSGSVGQITFTARHIEDAFLLEGEPVRLSDTRRGFSVGKVIEVSEQDRGETRITCLTRLGTLNMYGVQAPPFTGTLRQAFTLYAGLAGQTAEVVVDDSIANRQVVFPGWFGELWYNLKLMAAAQRCEVSLVSGVILLRPLRANQVIKHRDLARSRSFGGATLARAVEVYYYDNKKIENKLVYPPGGWTPETEVLTVSAGEVAAYDLELSASVSAIRQPVMTTFVSSTHSTSSVYTIVGDDGLPIVPAQWEANGGRMSLEINKDTTSLRLRIRGAEGIMGANGKFISTYSLALGSDLTSNRYSTLRIVGTGVAFDKQKIRVRTCVDPSETGTDIGITIDNPFLNSINDAWQTGLRAAKRYAGQSMEISGNLASVNQIGETGFIAYPKYSFDKQQAGNRDYSQVQAMHAGRTYADIMNLYLPLVRDAFENQVFGNVNGARVWDERTRRFYRVRSATSSTSSVSFDAEDDLTRQDFIEHYSGLTYAEESELFAGRTYSQRDRLGLRGDFNRPTYGAGFPSETNFPSLENFPINA